MISADVLHQILAVIAVGMLYSIARSLEQLVSLLKAWRNEITPKIHSIARDLDPDVPPYLKSHHE